MAKLASVELGGTKTLVGVGSGPEDLEVVARIPTGKDPEQLVGLVAASIDATNADGLGIASFGPLNLDRTGPDYGRVERTPKPGWSGFDVLGELAASTGLPVAIDTDVNAAALAEGKWGAARGVRYHAYITVGTGIGVGVVFDGEPVMGLGHPELGHIAVARLDGDEFEGVCPYHGDCLEGMASGPALAQRLGGRIETLDAPARTEARDLAAGYLAQGVRTLVYGFSPERVIIGGGISQLDGFHVAVGTELTSSLAGYREPSSADFVVGPGLGGHSGVLGGIILAARVAR